MLPAANVRRVAADADPVEAAAFTLATLTAWRMLVSRARVTAGEHVLIWGIGGGVALACLQIAKLLGAYVTVTSGSDEKLERAARARRRRDAQSSRRGRGEARCARGRRSAAWTWWWIRSGEATWAQSLGALGRRGRLVTCGGTSGPMVTTDVRRLFWNQWSILGSTMGNDAEFDAVVEHFRAGRLRRPMDSVYALDDARAAFERLASGEQFGKLVIRIAS